MFIRRQDVIDQFAENFRQTEDSEILFQPKKATIGVPASWEEYEAVMAAFERTQMVNVAITWVAILGAGAYGFYHSLADGRFGPFFLAIGIAFVFSIALSAQGGLRLLQPFIRRREELLKANRMVRGTQAE